MQAQAVKGKGKGKAAPVAVSHKPQVTQRTQRGPTMATATRVAVLHKPQVTQLTQRGPTIATAIRAPLVAVKGKGQQVTTAATTKGQGAKTRHMFVILRAAGNTGLTWQAIRASLIKQFGQAPKKRRSLYLLLAGHAWYKKVGNNGVVTYILGYPPIGPLGNY